MSNWHIWVRERNGDLDNEVTDFKQIDVIDRRRDVGSWSIALAADTAGKALATPGAGILLERDDFDAPVFSGPMTQAEPVWTTDGEFIICSGYSDNYLLWNYLAYPSTPDWEAPSGAAFLNAAYDVQEELCETVLKHYVSFNLQNPDRAVEGVQPVTVAPNLLRGTLVNARGRFQILGDLLRDLAVVGGDLNFGLINKQFDVSVPTDRTAEQVFSIDTGNLREYRPKIAAPQATRVLVAGGGEEVQRVFALRSNEAVEEEWGLYLEHFEDRRDTTDLTEMAQTGDQVLLEKGAQVAVELRVIDMPHRRYGHDWNVNDYVTLQEIRSVINGVTITLNEAGETITPAVNSTTAARAQEYLQMYDEIRSLRRRVNQLERTR